MTLLRVIICSHKLRVSITRPQAALMHYATSLDSTLEQKSDAKDCWLSLLFAGKQL